jgi:sulfate transport system ATP-binding protein
MKPGRSNVTIEARGITKQFGGFTALRDVSLEVKEGELVALLGPSGSGKTTLLRIVAGLEFADRGRVLFDGEDATERSARDRRVGFVFQHYALFRHMTVFENVAFGLRVQGRRSRPSPAVIRARVAELLSLVQLDGMAQRLPSQLSGGQRQRVALARALAVQPRVLLLDEPFGALDSRVRKELRRWLRNLHDELGITSVFVTHDQEEALELADRVVVMDHGRIEQVGTPEQVYHEPSTRFVYEFLGDVNIFHARVERGLARVEEAAFLLGDAAGERAERASIYVRPHLLEIHRRSTQPEDLRARVERIHAAGPTVKVELLTDGGGTVQAEISQERCADLQLARGDEVYVRPRQKRVFVEDYAI